MCPSNRSLARRFALLASITLVLAAPLSARGGTVSTGFAHQNSYMECYVGNLGTTPVLVNSVQLLNENGSALGATPADCTFPGTIYPGLGCFIIGQPGVGGLARCVANVAGSGKYIRVHLNVRNVSDAFFDVSESH